MDGQDDVGEKPPHAWDDADVALALRVFSDRRPAVPARLVTRLWSYWRNHAPDRPPFEDDEQNLALVLHATALGIRAVPTGDRDPLAALVDRIGSDDVCAPLTPRTPPWGPRAALSPVVRAALSSTLHHVQVVTDGRGPVEVLVVGTGLPEIREQVVPAVLTASLRINGPGADVVSDLVGVGVLRVGIDSATTGSAPDLASSHGRRAPLGTGTSARVVLRDLVGFLRGLERDTNLVRVTEVDQVDVVAFDRAVRDLAGRAVARPRGAFLRPAVPAGSRGLVALLPYLRTDAADEARFGAGVGLELDPDLLTTASYRLLDRTHHRALARRVSVDARLRRDQLEADLARIRGELEAFTRASADERRLMWESTVTLETFFDNHSGIHIKLSTPEEIDAVEYYATNVPNLIRLQEAWALRMSDLIADLDAAINRPQAPARQLAAGRFLDAALRGVVPDESAATREAFLRWQDEVAPMLRYEWREAVRRQGIDPADVFTPHTLFRTGYLPPVGDDPAALSVRACSVVDEDLSALLADSARRVLVIRDAADHAVDDRPRPEDRAEAEAAWTALAGLAERGDAAEFDAAFVTALRAHPRYTVERLVAELEPPSPPSVEAAEIEDELAAAQREHSLGEGMERAIMAMRLSAFITARECLDRVVAEPDGQARACLLRAIVECVAAGLPDQDIPELLGTLPPGLPPAAERAMDEAVSRDRAFTTKWQSLLPAIDLDRAIRLLFRGLPRATTRNSRREYGAWLFRGAIETAGMATRLTEAAGELGEDSQAVDSALVALGGVLEEILLGPYVGGPRGQAQALFELLTGHRPPRYGQTEGR
ncbi:hypothetical protein ACFFQW_14420 [Umezawaea endophytica]|uniref:Uncharacterized protein n=1 Tax=Umezawaea endophytica TaxID=1654476 RepID=A0A9X2VJN7_9PSEU|nr:hypothetical protein [Umezawaea endophytica]MCS7477880.1 hypothetical protein [Umezawaea endophytica]